MEVVTYGRCPRRTNIKRHYQVPTRYQVSLPLSDPWIPRIYCNPLAPKLTALMAPRYCNSNSTRGPLSSVLGPTLSHPTPYHITLNPTSRHPTFHHNHTIPRPPATSRHPTSHHNHTTLYRTSDHRTSHHSHTTLRICHSHIQQQTRPLRGPRIYRSLTPSPR